MTYPHYPHHSQPGQPSGRPQGPSQNAPQAQWPGQPGAVPPGSHVLGGTHPPHSPNTRQFAPYRPPGSRISQNFPKGPQDWVKNNPLIAVVIAVAVMLFGCCGVVTLAVSEDSSGGVTPGVYNNNPYGNDGQQNNNDGNNGGGQVNCAALEHNLKSIQSANDSLQRQIDSGTLSPAMEGIYKSNLIEGQSSYDKVYSRYMKYC